MDLEEEKKLVKRAQNDIDAFSELYDCNYQKILNYILKRIGNVALAEDITSIVFIQAMKKIGQFKWRGIHFSAWLYRIAGNKIAEHFRKNKKGQIISLDVLMERNEYEPISLQDIHDEIIEAEDKIKINRDCKRLLGVLKELPRKYQEVITLKYLENKTISEICEILRRKESTIKSQLCRGREKLRERMDREAETQPINRLNTNII